MTTTKTLMNGWVKIRRGDEVFVEHDPALARLLMLLGDLDAQVFADCTEHLR